MKMVIFVSNNKYQHTINELGIAKKAGGIKMLRAEQSRAEQSRAEQSRAECSIIDVYKYVMAFCVIAIHTSPLKNIENSIIYSAFDTFTSMAVPFFFLSTGYLIGTRLDKSGMNNVNLIAKQQKKLIRYYLVWTAIYLPITIFGFYRTRTNVLKAVAIFIRNVLLQGENYYSWPLWYLLSAIYGLAIWKFITIKTGDTKLYFAIVIGAFIFLHCFTNYMLTLNDNILGSVLEKTIGKGRFFCGTYYILIGSLIAKEKNARKCIAIVVFLMSFLFTMYFHILPLKIIVSVSFFKLVISSKWTGEVKCFRRTSTIMYYTHMIFFFILNVTVHSEMYGMVGFLFCCAMTNILACIVNNGNYKNDKVIVALFGRM